MTAGRTYVPRTRFRILVILTTVLSVFAAGVVGAPAALADRAHVESVAESISGPVPAADLTTFQAGNIISDAVFFNRGAMSAEQIQSFLESKVPTCQSGYTCLKDWYDTSRTTTADAMCGAYSGGVRERASTIIFKVAQACGINPQVILATLQKEQGLVLHTWPSDWRYTIAMGQGCPDTAGCDTKYYGFFNQVYGAAWQFKRYANPPGTSQYFTWYAPGKTWNVRYSPDASCGSSPVMIQNQATANLYYYTPYQPNSAALRAGYGTGDGCSAYGNRNFYQYFTDWFGSTQVPLHACDVPPQSATVPAGGEYVTTANLNGRAAPSTECPLIVDTLAQGTLVTRIATFDKWWYVRAEGGTYWVHSDYLVPAPAVAYTTSRLSGINRYETAIQVSKATYPAGAATVFIASGADFPDALAAGAAAGHAGAALLLTEPSGLPPSVSAELIRLKPSRVVLVGGESRVSVAVRTAAAAAVPTASVERIAGINRYETSRMLASSFFPVATSAYVVTGLNYPDAIVAAGLGGMKGAPVLLVDGTASTVENATIATLRASGVTSIIIAGSNAAVSSGIEAGLSASGFAVRRIGGVDRYETSFLLNVDAYPSGAAAALFATGAGFADALTGSVLAARTHAPLFTTPPTCMTSASKDWMIASGVTSVTLIGGPPALADTVAASVRC